MDQIKYKENQKIISRKKANLLLLSSIIGSYPWLRDILERKRYLNGQEYHVLTYDQRRVIDGTLDALLTQAANEWQALSRVIDLGGNRKRCTLCNTKIRYECYIKNSFSSEEVIVGSECVKSFGFIVQGNKTITELVRDAKRLRRRQILDGEFDGMHERLVDLNRHLSSYPVLIPERLEQPYTKTGEQLRRLYNAYLDGEVKEGEAIPQLRSHWEELRKEITDIGSYVESVQSHPFAPTRRIVKVLTDSGDIIAINMLKQDELIRPRTLHRINESKFIQSLIPLWNDILVDINITLDGILETKVAYLFRISSVQLGIPHKELCLMFGPMIFNENPVVELSIINMIHKSFPHNSTNELVNLLLPELRVIGYHLHRRYNDYGSLVLKTKEDSYISISEENLAVKMMRVALGLSEKPRKQLLQYVQAQRQYTIDQIKSLEFVMGEFGQSPARRRAR